MFWNPDRWMADLIIRSVRAVACATIALTLSCAMHSHSSVPRPGSFISGEYAAYDSIGTGEVEGWGSAAPEAGRRRSIAQRTVVLTPVTTWSQRWWNQYVLADRPTGTPEPRVRGYLHTVDADSSGHFQFAGLHEGRYYLLMSTVWVIGEPGKTGSEVVRVRMGKQIALAQGEHASVILDSLRTDRTSSDRLSMMHGQGPDSLVLGPGPPDQQN